MASFSHEGLSLFSILVESAKNGPFQHLFFLARTIESFFQIWILLNFDGQSLYPFHYCLGWMHMSVHGEFESIKRLFLHVNVSWTTLTNPV